MCRPVSSALASQPQVYPTGGGKVGPGGARWATLHSLHTHSHPHTHTYSHTAPLLSPTVPTPSQHTMEGGTQAPSLSIQKGA